MHKWWSALFFLVPILGVGLFVLAGTVWYDQWWLPTNVSTYGEHIDRLFYIILVITAVTFVLTEVALAWFLYRYPGQPGQKGTYIHTHHRTELIWTLVPAAILVFVAGSQMWTWAHVKMSPKLRQESPLALIVARQFEWRIRYVGLDGAPGVAGVDDDADGITDWQEQPNGTRIPDWDEWGAPGSDDVETVGDLHLPADQDVVVHLRSLDVLHSFFLPHLRVKQDAVPGLTIPMWFRIDSQKAGIASGEPVQFDLICAELCGWGHYKMRGRLVAHTVADFQSWLRRTQEEQQTSGRKSEESGHQRAAETGNY